MPQASSSDLGANLVTALHLQTKHQTLLTDISVRQKSAIDAVFAQGKRLAAQTGHYAHSQITMALSQLEDLWSSLKKAALARDTALATAVQTERYLVDANEVCRGVCVVRGPDWTTCL